MDICWGFKMTNKTYAHKTLKIVFATMLMGLTSACSQYLERNEGVTLSAGDAVAQNKAVQMIDPWPLYAGQTNIPGNGERLLVALKKYRENKPDKSEGSDTQNDKKSEE